MPYDVFCRKIYNFVCRSPVCNRDQKWVSILYFGCLVVENKIGDMKRKIVLAAFLVALFVVGGLQRGYAQKVALKTNLLYDATATANLGIEFGLGKEWTMDISGNINGGWNPIGEARYEHMYVQPEFRYWFCNRFAGHFVGLHFHTGSYTVGNIRNEFVFLGSNFYQLTDHTYDGTFFGAGVAYGYDIVLGAHFNLEVEAGFGFAYTVYDKFRTNSPAEPVETGQQHYYLGPTKASISLVYLF